MKKFKVFAVILIMLGLFFIPIVSVSAQINQNTSSLTKIPNPSRYTDLEDIINALTSLIRPVFIVTFAAMVLYGGWVRITSQGDPDKIKKSSQIIIAAIVGFGIVVFSTTIVDLAGKLLGVNSGLITQTGTTTPPPSSVP